MKEQKSKLVLTHKILFWVTLVAYVIDLIVFGTVMTILTDVWVISSLVVFVLSIIILSKKPKKKTFPIIALIITSIPALIFVLGIILGVAQLV